MITDDDIRRVVPPRSFAAGVRYHLDGRVQELRMAADGTTINALVLGSGHSIYEQSIRLQRGRNGRLQVHGLCSCPVGFNCKHVTAVLLECQERTRTGTGLTGYAPPLVDTGSVRGRPSKSGSPPIPPAEAEPAALPHEIEVWLRDLNAAQQEDSEDYPLTVRKRLLYILEQGSYSGGLMVHLQSIELRRDDVPSGIATPHQAAQLLRSGQQPKFLRPSDRMILVQLTSTGAEGSEGFITTLQAIIATGRGRWARWDGPALTKGAAVSGAMEWQLGDNGNQSPVLILPDNLRTLRLTRPWYVDPATGVMGPIETGLPSRLLCTLLAAPAIPPNLVERLRTEIDRRWPGHAVPVPRVLAAPEPLRTALHPHLLLRVAELPFDPAAILAPARYRHVSSTDLHRVSLIKLSWRYGPITIPSGDPFQPHSIVQHDGKLFQLQRDLTAEEQVAATLDEFGFQRLDRFHVLSHSDPHCRDLALLDPDPGVWLEFVLHDVPCLRREGWIIDVDDDFPLRLVEPSGDIDVVVTEASGVDWFDVDLGVMIDGHRIGLVPALFDFIANVGMAQAARLDIEGGDDTDDEELPLLLPLPDGRLLVLPFERLRPVLAPLFELFGEASIDEAAGTLRLTRRNAGDLALLEAATAGSNIAWSGGEAIRILGRQLRDHGGLPPCAVPPGFTAVLRPYQQQGLDWLQFLRSAGLGGVLADDMGLGKTVQALAHLAVEQAEGRAEAPSLVICPTSLVENWRAEAYRFAPNLHCLVLHGADRASHFEAIGTHDVVITTYPLLARDHAVLLAQDWHVVVLDEAQTIKNPQATVSKLTRTLKARQRLCLSGTPLENHLGELWSLFDFLMPGLLGDRRQFGSRYRGPIEKGGDHERQALLARRIAPFLLRRTKEQVAPELPAKTEITETVTMGEAQRAIYEGIRLAMHAKVRAAVARRGVAGSGIVILDALLKLRQACCDPRLLKLSAAKAAKAKSAKLERLFELLLPLLEEGRRVLLFSQFTSMLALVEAELVQLSLPYVLLTGDTRDRADPVRRFQSGAVPLFLISLKAGGVGLNLTAADTVIHYDPWWNPAVENQATDRAHRIGQDKPVFVHRLITAATVEEKMQVLKGRKQALADGILGAGSGTTLALTEADLEMLFG